MDFRDPPLKEIGSSDRLVDRDSVNRDNTLQQLTWRAAMSAHAIETESPLVFTEAAARKVTQLIDEEGNNALKLRVFISAGGCSGFLYGFTFDETINDGDTAVEQCGVTLLIDPMSFQYQVGAEIDYTEGPVY